MVQHKIKTSDQTTACAQHKDNKWKHQKKSVAGRLVNLCWKLCWILTTIIRHSIYIYIHMSAYCLQRYLHKSHKSWHARNNDRWTHRRLICFSHSMKERREWSSDNTGKCYRGSVVERRVWAPRAGSDSLRVTAYFQRDDCQQPVFLLPTRRHG